MGGIVSESFQWCGLFQPFQIPFRDFRHCGCATMYDENHTGGLKFLANTDAVIGDYSDIGTDRSSRETPLLGDGTLFTNRIDGTLKFPKTNVEPIARLTQMVREAELFDQVGRPNMGLHSAPWKKYPATMIHSPWDQAA
ncbi:MAG: hypothetical protein R2857_06480 [Vampirovibrionales bacterium]